MKVGSVGGDEGGQKLGIFLGVVVVEKSLLIVERVLVKLTILRQEYQGGYCYFGKASLAIVFCVARYRVSRN